MIPTEQNEEDRAGGREEQEPVLRKGIFMQQPAAERPLCVRRRGVPRVVVLVPGTHQHSMRKQGVVTCLVQQKGKK